MKYRSTGSLRRAATLISLTIATAALMPSSTHASVWEAIFSVVRPLASADGASTVSRDGNLQTMALLRPAMNIDPAPARGGGDITIVDDSALLPEEGPAGTIADISKPKNSIISVYIVREGDTLSGIAQLFGVKPSTILWANDLPKASQLQVGQKLIILPVTGVKYTTRSGDTLASVAKRFGGDANEISSFNGLDGDTLPVGMDIIIPNGEIAVSAPASTTAPTRPRSTKVVVGAEPAHDVGPAGTASERSYYIAPLADYIKTQGIHGYNAVDLAAPTGTPLLASATGDVIVAKGSGWNGGYGEYIVIQHDNGSQTLYGHASRVIVSIGQHVVQGQVIGYVGATGKATGPHVHFEIRNGIRNPF